MISLSIPFQCPIFLALSRVSFSPRCSLWASLRLFFLSSLVNSLMFLEQRCKFCSGQIVDRNSISSCINSFSMGIIRGSPIINLVIESFFFIEFSINVSNFFSHSSSRNTGKSYLVTFLNNFPIAFGLILIISEFISCNLHCINWSNYSVFTFCTWRSSDGSLILLVGNLILFSGANSCSQVIAGLSDISVPSNAFSISSGVESALSFDCLMVSGYTGNKLDKQSVTLFSFPLTYSIS